jgi:signal peptidase II
MSPKVRTLIALLVSVVLLDQLTKGWIANYVSPFEPITVIEGFFRITHSRNPGAAFGLAQSMHVSVFVALTILALALIGSFFRQIAADDRLSATSLGLIMAGAIGNLIDRVTRGEVVDFLQFDLGLFIFPDFNVADSAICIGVALLLLDVVVQEAEESVGRPVDGEREP